MIHFYEEYLVGRRIMSIFALYNVDKQSMTRQKREKSGTGICHVMQGQESKTCPYDFLVEQYTILNDVFNEKMSEYEKIYGF